MDNILTITIKSWSLKTLGDAVEMIWQDGDEIIVSWTMPIQKLFLIKYKIVIRRCLT